MARHYQGDVCHGNPTYSGPDHTRNNQVPLLIYILKKFGRGAGGNGLGAHSATVGGYHSWKGILCNAREDINGRNTS